MEPGPAVAHLPGTPPDRPYNKPSRPRLAFFWGGAMTFRETLDKHIRAIQARDLQGLIDTLPADELILIMADGQLVRTVREFVELHRDWFQGKTWSLTADPVSVYESPELGVAVLHLDYRDTPAGRPPVQETSYLTLVFRRQGDRWVMVQDQNTPVRRPAS